MLAYSRDNEAEADAHGFKWMLKAGYNPRDMVSMFNKMNKQRWFEGGKVPLYLRTHPFTDDRIVELSHQLAMHQSELPPERDNPDFQYFTIKLEAICGNPNQLLRRMTQDAIHEPQNPVFQYGKGLALARLEKDDEATAAFQQALKLAPGQPLIQRDLAIFYFHQNRYPGLPASHWSNCRSAYPQDDVVLYYLGRIYQERKQIDKALPLFEKVHQAEPHFQRSLLQSGHPLRRERAVGPGPLLFGISQPQGQGPAPALFHFQKGPKESVAGGYPLPRGAEASGPPGKDEGQGCVTEFDAFAWKDCLTYNLVFKLDTDHAHL